MHITHADHNIRFLAGGGEMGRLIREKDWSNTALGSPSSWPQSLRTTLSIILNSRFPMFLFWGQELICFYNDAYRPSLGREGKHPSILGMKGEDAWTEIWPTIQPLIRQVLDDGVATWSEDQLIPIFRNETIEDVYWTFSYSPVNDESGKHAAVFVTCIETTEKVNIHNRLEESKNELEFAIEATELGTWDYNPVTNKFLANERLKKWFGLSADEQFELSNALNAIRESEKQKVADAIQHALDYSSGGLYDIEYTIVHPVTKKETVVHAKGKAWFNEDKTPYRFNGTLEDISAKSVAAKQIKESIERYHQLIYSSPSAIGILYGPDLVITIANDAIIEIWGKGKDIIGKSYFEALPELAAQGYREVFNNVYQTGISFNAVETPVQIFQNGELTLKYYNFLLYPQKDINGRIDGIGILATEVTSQALLNNQIKESKQRFAAAVEAVKGIVWTNNGKGEMTGEQLGWSGLTGQSFDEYQGYGWANAVHPDDAFPTINAWKEALKEEKTFHFEHRVKIKDGTWRSFSIKAIPLKNEDGSLREWVGVHTDIQEQKAFATELERQVQERTKQLEEKNIELEKMNKELQSFAYISSHDLQEPLRKIQTFASHLMEKEKQHLSETGRHYFKRMQDSASRMQILIDDLLAYSRMNTAERIFISTDLNTIVEEVKADLNEELLQKNATIDSTELCEADIIPFQFRQLLYNLFSNALKFSKPDIPPHIIITSRKGPGSIFSHEKLLEGNQYCHIHIEDNGIGFEQRFSEKIFELFQRLHIQQEYTGTGIGLAIVKKIVENHQGIITAISEINKGTTFDIFLPVR